jgi:hypothetical protein
VVTIVLKRDIRVSCFVLSRLGLARHNAPRTYRWLQDDQKRRSHPMIGESRHINRRVTQSAFRAFDYAKADGHKLNTYVVLRLRETVAQGAATAFTRIRHKYRDWLTYRGRKLGESLSPIYVYALENPAGWLHVNWAIHIPSEMLPDFERKLEKWVARTQGPVERGDIHVQPIDPQYAKYLAKYMFKGTDPAYVRHFFLQNVHSPQGSIYGKRAGVSQAIGIKARLRANFHPGRNRSYIPPNMSGIRTSGMIDSQTRAGHIAPDIN